MPFIGPPSAEWWPFTLNSDSSWRIRTSVDSISLALQHHICSHVSSLGQWPRVQGFKVKDALQTPPMASVSSILTAWSVSQNDVKRPRSANSDAQNHMVGFPQRRRATAKQRTRQLMGNWCFGLMSPILGFPCESIVCCDKVYWKSCQSQATWVQLGTTGRRKSMNVSGLFPACVQSLYLLRSKICPWVQRQRGWGWTCHCASRICPQWRWLVTMGLPLNFISQVSCVILRVFARCWYIDFVGYRWIQPGCWEYY